jgi:hypothetical protein
VLTSFLELNERQQLWGIYDAFDGFEQQMEDALDGIFDKDVPPSVTAVAASLTQSYQSIIGCDNTRIFMDDKKRKLGLSFIDKNVIVEPTWSLDGFEHKKLNDIRSGRRKEVERLEQTIPVVPFAYSDFLNLVN